MASAKPLAVVQTNPVISLVMVPFALMLKKNDPKAAPVRAE
jgi:hypothetical protein